MEQASCAYLLRALAAGAVDTPIGEMGMKLSGGERQRLSIARALVRHPRLLIFDEATSALDSITEEQITETMRRVSALQMQITILIAHRLSTIMHADTIHVLEKGRIVESGGPRRAGRAQGPVLRHVAAADRRAAGARGTECRRQGGYCRPGRAEQEPI